MVCESVGLRHSQADYRHREEETDAPFVFPYNLGRWKNFRLVCHFRRRRELDGCWWPVIDGCDQYTLTVISCDQLVHDHGKL